VTIRTTALSKSVSLLLAITLGASCRGDPKRPEPAIVSRDACDAHQRAIVLGPDSIAGISMRTPLGELLAKCGGAVVDTVSPGGYQVLSVRIPLHGATVWAVSDSEPYTAHMDLTKRPSFWYASGDSLRFPDGQIIPSRLGPFRKSFPGALLRADNVDDTEGSYIVTCSSPQVSLILGYLPELNDTSASRLDARPLPDTLSFWKIRIDTLGSPTDPALREICVRAPAT
jgi:hypothetical protein